MLRTLPASAYLVLLGQDAQGHLPACIGLQRVLGNRQASPGNTSSAPSHLHNRDEARELPPRQTHRPKPAAATEDGFLTRFTRNANVVASGVVKNMKRVGRYVKETVDDALTSDRKRHK
ncbi:PREDICTED: uncharacterized protein LOC104826761 isoform X2 [Tarenaya hassleriana]|uniref:uncharacterized protein LOC104826761 isoform X2 n=1 Tax=Tarenaya hassleriana TaxID=28532 RepID=UPI00053C5EF5|nr:PREDICTED: uncharacterized protein LOC104826761 isoform X2 [Tarenaya hassleriana]